MSSATPTWRGSARFSPCGAYRFTLNRAFAEGDGLVNFIMLNPSTADATANDPTVARCCRFATDWGYRRLVVTNLFALRATDPKELRFAADPVGTNNDQWIWTVANRADLVVAAWGVHGAFNDRGPDVAEDLIDHGIELCALGVTKDGHPRHPLYLPASAEPTPFVYGRTAA